MQRLHIGVCLQAARQEIDAPTDHREGVCVDHGPSAIKDMIPVFEVAVQEQVAALTHQLFPPEDGLNPRVHVDVAV